MLETNFNDNASPSTFYLPENEVKQARDVAIPTSSAEDKPLDFAAMLGNEQCPSYVNTHLSPMQPQIDGGQTQVCREAEGTSDRVGMKEHLMATPTPWACLSNSHQDSRDSQ